jgi:hypothetical protein
VLAHHVDDGLADPKEFFFFERCADPAGERGSLVMFMGTPGWPHTVRLRKLSQPHKGCLKRTPQAGQDPAKKNEPSLPSGLLHKRSQPRCGPKAPGLVAEA